MKVRETSIQAFRKIEAEGLLSKRRFEVYKILYENGPLTGGELVMMFQKIYQPKSPTMDRNIHARLTELRDLGVTQELRTRVCSVTGMNVIEWDVTRNLPEKPKKPTKIKCAHCKGKGYFIQERLFE